MSEPKELCRYCGGNQDLTRHDETTGQILSEVCPACHGRMFLYPKVNCKQKQESDLIGALEASMTAIEKFMEDARK